MEKHINLEEFAGGALSERVNMAMQEVTRNILDPNTPAKKKRTITVQITFTPAKNRVTVSADIGVKVSLASPESVSTAMIMGKDLRTGKVEASEIATRDADAGIPGQYVIQGENIVDTATGEAAPLPANIRRVAAN